MQDLRQGYYIIMKEEFDRREFHRARRVSDRYRVYVCWSQDEERELSSSRCDSYMSRHFRPGLFGVAAKKKHLQTQY